MFTQANFSDLRSFGVGHAENVDVGTGCTVFVAPEGAVCSVDVRGGGPATRETDLLAPENMIENVHAVVISGGSAFGLEAACGVMEELSERSIGFKLGDACVPIVPGACLFDLLVGEAVWPNKEMGREACMRALEAFEANEPNVAQGNVGAGCGATVGKMGLPERAMKSGFGWCGLKMPTETGESLVVIASVAVNAVGNVMAADGSWMAGTQDAEGNVVDPMIAAAEAMQAMDSSEADPVKNTTLGVVLTNANITKAQCKKVAQITHDAYARAIKPVHTLNDGDTVFVMASGEVDAATDVVGMLATEAMEHAIRNAVLNSESAYGLRGLMQNDC